MLPRSETFAELSRLFQLGLLDEINELWNLTQSPAETNYSRGIFQAIGAFPPAVVGPRLTLFAGYKEFEPYLSSRATTDEKASFDEHDPLFIAGLDSMKLSTRQYAKRQVKWIKQKLLPAVRKLGGEDVTIVLLDATGASCAFRLVWEEADGSRLSQTLRRGRRTCEIRPLRCSKVRFSRSGGGSN